MVDVCCDSAIEASVVISNTLSTPKTFKLFGGSIDTPSIPDNEYSFRTENPSFLLSDSGVSYLFDAVTGWMYIGGQNSLSVVDTQNNNSILNLITTGVGDKPQCMTLVPSLRRIYVSCSGVSTFTNNLIVINADTGLEISRHTVGYTPNQSVYCPTNGYLYIACRFGAVLSIFNTATGVTLPDVLLDAGGQPTCLCYDPIHEYVYIPNGNTNPGDGKVDVYNINTISLLSPVVVGDGPVQAIYQNGFVYVATQFDVSVSRINTNTNVNSLISGFTAPTMLFYYSATNKIYVCSVGDTSLGVINVDTGLTETPIGTGGSICSYILYNSFNDYVYVFTGSSVIVFNNDFSEIIDSLSPSNATGFNGYNAADVSTINGSMYQISNTTNGVSVTSTEPGVVIAPNGNVSIEQMNSDFESNPVCICKLNIVSTLKSAFNTPLSKNESLSTGSVLNTKISLLAHYTVDDEQNVVILNKEDFKTCVLDGENYLEWEIPANCVISIVLSYCQKDRVDMLGKDRHTKIRPKKKRYMHGAFKFAIN